MHGVLQVSIFFTVVLGVLSEPPKLETCESPIGQVSSAQVIGGKYKDGKYILKRGEDAGIEVNFTTDKKINEIKVFATITLNGMQLSQGLDEIKPCESLKCPLKKGGAYMYKINMPVLSIYPQIETVAKLELKNEDEEVLACVEVPVKIV